MNINLNRLTGQLPLILALAIIAILLILWRPDGTSNSGRTITVTGEAEIAAEPDEYVFNPSYEFSNAEQAAALDEATDKTNQIIAELKKLGVADSKIKRDTGGGYRWYYNDQEQTYYAYLTVTVNQKDLAQKVQDYLLTTTPTGSVTPNASFSKAKQAQLESQGRDQATKNARDKAEQSAKNLGFKVGKVKSVKDSPENFYLGYDTLEAGAAVASDRKANSSPIQVGENDFTYQVTVTYFVD